jgi:hypothetical protein
MLAREPPLLRFSPCLDTISPLLFFNELVIQNTSRRQREARASRFVSGEARRIKVLASVAWLARDPATIGAPA